MKLEILCYPDARLNLVAKPVAQVDARIQQLVDDMLETMYAANGVGLASIQVNVQERVVVIDVSETRDEPMVLINPRVVAHSETRVVHEEGCLSVPDIYDNVERWESVVAEALDRDGKLQRIEAQGLLAVCIQHEIDHLDGHVFVEYLSALKRNRIRTKLVKRAKEQARENSKQTV